MHRDVPWPEVRAYLQRKLDSALGDLQSCPLDSIERVRGRIEAYKALMQLEQQQGSPSGAPSPFHTMNP